MQRPKLPSILLAAICVYTPSFWAEDAVKSDSPKTSPSPTDSKSEQSYTGSLTNKGVSSKPGVVAVLKLTRDDKVEWVDVWAIGDPAKKLEDWAAQHAEVTVIGTLTPDGIKVTSVKDDIKLPPEKGKKKKK